MSSFVTITMTLPVFIQLSAQYQSWTISTSSVFHHDQSLLYYLCHLCNAQLDPSYLFILFFFVFLFLIRPFLYYLNICGIFVSSIQASPPACQAFWVMISPYLITCGISMFGPRMVHLHVRCFGHTGFLPLSSVASLFWILRSKKCISKSTNGRISFSLIKSQITLQKAI